MRVLPPPVDHHAGKRTGQRTGLHCERPIDQDILDSFRIAAWIQDRGAVAETVEVEDHEVGLVALADVAPVGEADDLRGEAGPRTDRKGEADHALFLDVIGDFTRKSAIIARMQTGPGRHRNTGVGGGGRVFLPHVVRHVEGMAGDGPE